MNVVWDPEKAKANLTKHGIDFADAAVALEDQNALTVAEIEYGEYRFKTLAMSPAVEVLLIVHAERDEDTVRIISARRADRKERQQYSEGGINE